MGINTKLLDNTETGNKQLYNVGKNKIMTTKIYKLHKLHNGALNNKSFLKMIKDADSDKIPGLLSNDLEKHFFASVYYGWLAGMYDINWESNI